MWTEFTTTYAISAYHHWCCEFKSRSGQSVQHYVIKFVSDIWRQVSDFLWALVSSTNKADRHDITEILLIVALNTIKLTSQIKLHVYMQKPQHQATIYNVSVISLEKSFQCFICTYMYMYLHIVFTFVLQQYIL